MPLTLLISTLSIFVDTLHIARNHFFFFSFLSAIFVTTEDSHVLISSVERGLFATLMRQEQSASYLFSFPFYLFTFLSQFSKLSRVWSGWSVCVCLGGQNTRVVTVIVVVCYLPSSRFDSYRLSYLGRDDFFFFLLKKQQHLQQRNKR